ncbi:CFI-box-CTERM domain-containing protein [Microbacterium sp. MC2]
MPEWYQVGLPDHLTWHSNAPFWRSAVIAESRKTEPSAFAGRNLLRVFQPLHTQYGVVLDLILVLIDVPRERVLLAAFPGFLGMTTGAGIPMPTEEQREAMRRGEKVSASDVPILGGDKGLRAAAAAAEQRIAAESGVRQVGILGPDGDRWSVYLQELPARAPDFLEADGHTLTQQGAQRVERFVRGVVTAAREWVPEGDGSRRGDVVVQVKHASPVTGPTLKESLAPSESPAQAPKSGGCYVATAVYGSYDAPEVWVLRRWRDDKLLKSVGGRLFVRSYYATSPWVVRKVGRHTWFTRAARPLIGRLVGRLRRRGVSALPYSGL